MNTYLLLIRGINVGLKNRVPMADLKKSLEEAGFSDVRTYIASGNVILQSAKDSKQIKSIVEDLLTKNYSSDGQEIKVLVLTYDQLSKVVKNKPKGFGEEPANYHTDVIFLMDLEVRQIFELFSPKEGIDVVWPGDGVIYSQRLSELRTKSRLNRIMSVPEYKSMTIRTWNTTKKLLELMKVN